MPIFCPVEYSLHLSLTFRVSLVLTCFVKPCAAVRMVFDLGGDCVGTLTPLSAAVFVLPHLFPHTKLQLAL